MPEFAPPTARNRLLRRFLYAWLYIAVFGALWWQFGAGAILFMLAWCVIAIAIRLVSRVIPRRRPRAGRVDTGTLHERIFSPVPTEATVARKRLSEGLLGGTLWLGFISSMLAGFTGAPFLIVFLAVALSAVFTGTMILAWAISRARRRNQFSVATLLILMTISAVYLAVIRLLVDWSGEPFLAGTHPFLSVAVACFIMIGFSLPLLLIFMVQLVWFAAWLVRRPWVQRWLKAPQSTRNSPLRVEEEEGERLQ